MQLISALFTLFSVVTFVLAIRFVCRWHNVRKRAAVVQLLREQIEHIGISAVVNYPDTPKPLLALLEEEYSRSEAIVVTDLQCNISQFGYLIRQYNLVRVNHSHLKGVRALYRSRHRTFRRVVLVDLPTEYQGITSEIVGKVASFDYILHLQGESVVARDAITYCANVVASYRNVEDVSVRSIVGAEARLERNDMPHGKRGRVLLADRAFAWSGRVAWLSVMMLFVPGAVALSAYFMSSTLMFATAVVLLLELILFLYISCRVVTEKNLFITLDTILRHFYRFIVERVEKKYYLYKWSNRGAGRCVQPPPAILREDANN